MSSSLRIKEYATWLFVLNLVLFSITVSGQETTETNPEAAGEAASGQDTASKDTKPPEIYMAAKQGRLKRLQMLIEEGADINASNALGRTALMGATFYRNVRVMEELLIEGADVNAKDNNGRTALMIAVNKKDTKLTTMLLDAGADVTIADKNNKTALMIAETLKAKELSKLLEAAKPAEGGGKE